MKLGDFSIPNVVWVDAGSSLYDIAETMRRHHVGAVVVRGIHDRKPHGIVTDRDLVVEVMAARLDPDKLVAEDIMSLGLTVAEEDEDLWEAVHRMQAESIRRIPVVNARGELSGMFSLDDLLNVLASELNGLVSLVARERNREAALRS